MSQHYFKNILYGWIKYLLSGLILSAVLVPPSIAHLMVAQHGTLNFVGGSAFMVLSLPVSAFKSIDDDGDGKMSAAEFSKHRPEIVAAINKHIRLQDSNGIKTFRGMMLSPVASHEDPKAPTEQLIVMGRFVLDDLDATLKFHADLFGKKTAEQTLTITATRSAEPRKHKIVLTPAKPEDELWSNMAKIQPSNPAK